MLDTPDNRPYVVGEIGFNHNGSVDEAKDLIRKLDEAGADCAKFQLYRTDHLISGVYLSDVIDVFRDHELSRDDYLDCLDVAAELEIEVAASVFDRELLRWYVEHTSPPFIKIASGDLTFKRLLVEAGQHDVPIVLSVGGGTIDEMKRACRWINPDPGQLILLHCISEYPAEESRLHLRRIEYLREELGYPVGFSDHSESLAAPLVASALGAEAWERHVTLDCDQEGPEHGFSLEVDQLETIINRLTNVHDTSPDNIEGDVETILGKRTIELTDADREFRQNARRSLMADRPLTVGSQLSEDMIRELRPGTGLPAGRIDDCLGLPVQRPTDPLHMITY